MGTMCRRPRPQGAIRAGGRVAAAGVLALAAALGMAGSASAAVQAPGAEPSGTAAAAAASGAWPVYHQNLLGTGVAPSVTAVNTRTRAWTSPALDGDIYGEPLVFAGRVYVATQNDTVYGLAAATGRLLWSRHLGRPVPAGLLPCGNIGPTVGITGTPVIDRARREIFVVAEELVRGRPAHILAGLATASGRVEMTRDVDLAGTDPAAQLQRTGLTLDAGRVVFGLGGNFGDCGNYRGKVEAIPETAGGRPEAFIVDSGRGESQGAVWMGGAAPVVDGRGHVWVTVGNGSVTSFRHPYDFSDSVLELSPAMRLVQFFAPRTWATDNASDLDMSMVPALLPSGQVIAAGKAGIAYLLNGARLGGIGHQQALLTACGDVIDGGFARAGMTVYLPCLSGVTAVRAARSPASLRLAWRTGTGGGPPIIAAGLVWTIGQNGTLYGLNPANGRIRQQASIGPPANHFPTPSVGDGVLLAPDARHVVAFRASTSRGAIPATPGPASTGPAGPASQSSPTGGGGISPAAIAGSVLGGLVLVGGGGLLVWRRRMASKRRIQLASR